MTTTILLGVVLLQWIVIVAISFFKRIPKSLIASTLILAAGYINAFGLRRESAAFKAAALPQHSRIPDRTTVASQTRLGNS